MPTTLIRYSLIGFLVFLLSGSLIAQDITERADLVTDRPDKTESSVSVPVHSIQIETGFSYIIDHQSDYSEKRLGYGETLIRYGLFEGMELRLAFDYSSSVTHFPLNGVDYTARGFSPMAAGLKVNLTEQQGWVPELALIIHVQFAAFYSVFSPDYAIPDMMIAASHSITPRFSLGYNAGMEWTDTKSPPVSIYSLVAGFSVSDRMGMFLETFGYSGNGELQLMIDGGVTFLVFPFLQLDISAGKGITAVSPDYFLATGFSIRLDQ